MKWPKKAAQEADPIELFELGKFGIIKDTKSHFLAPEAFSNGKNVRFTKNGLERFKGDLEIFEPLDIDPHMILSIPTASGPVWIYPSLDKLGLYDGANQYDVTRVSDDYGATEGYEWQATVIGGIPIFNNGVDPPQYWPDFTPTEEFADLPNWPEGLTAKVVKSFGPYLIAFNLNLDGVRYPKAIRWSHFADPGNVPDSWALDNPAEDGGQLQLTDDKGGEILDALLLGNQGIIYTENATHVARFVGGIDIFATDLLFKTSGILATNCVCSFNKGRGHAVITDNDIVVHSGTKETESIVEKRNRSAIFRELNPERYRYSHCFENSAENEVWFCYPTIGSNYPNVAFVWNYKDNTHAFRDIDFNRVDTGSVYQDSLDITWEDGELAWDATDEPWNKESKNKVVAVSAAQQKAFAIDQGTTFAAGDQTSFVERLGLAIDGKDQEGKPKGSIQTVKQLKRVWPKVTGVTPLTVRLMAQDYVDGPVKINPAKTHVPGSKKWVDSIIVGNLLGYRLEATAPDQWHCEGMDFDINVLSKL